MTNWPGSEYTHAGAAHDISPFPRLLLSCIDADRNEKWRVFKHFSKSTRNYTFSCFFCWNNQNLLHLVIVMKFSENSGDFVKFAKTCQSLCKNLHFIEIYRNLLNLLARKRFSCRFWKMLKNAYLDTKIGVDPAENEPRKEWCVVCSTSSRVR